MALTSKSLRGTCPFYAVKSSKHVRSCRVVVKAQAQSKNKFYPVTSLLLASTLTFTLGMSFAPVTLPARAEDVDVESMSPAEKRRELLRKAREAALARAAGLSESAPVTASPLPAPVVKIEEPSQDDDAAERRAAAEQLKEELMNSMKASVKVAPPVAPSEPPPPPPPEPMKPASPFSRFSLPMPSPPPPAPAPVVIPAAPTPPPPPPAPVVVKKVEAPKPAPQQVQPAKNGKRQGPLPLWLAQILLTAIYAGVILAMTKYNAQVSEIIAKVRSVILGLYAQAEQKLAGMKSQ